MHLEVQEIQEIQGFLKVEAEKWPQIFDISPAAVPHMEKVYSIVRQIYGRSPTDDLNDLDENNALWVYIHERHTPSCRSSWSRLFWRILRFTKNQLLMSVKQSFHVTGKLIKDQTDISGLTTINYKEPTWRLTTLPCDKAID